MIFKSKIKLKPSTYKKTLRKVSCFVLTILFFSMGISDQFIYIGNVANAATDTIAPTEPGNLICLSMTSTTADLLWDSSTDNVGVEGYIIYRDGKEIASTTTTEYTDKGLKSKKTYTYVVKAYDIDGNISNESNKIDITPDFNGVNSKQGSSLNEILSGPSFISEKSLDIDSDTILNSSSIQSTISNENILSVSVGAEFSMLLMNDGTLRAWGRNSYGQLGLGDTANRNMPTTISSLEGVRQISLGNAHSLALMEDGTVKAWGYNNYGQLGIGNTTNISSASNILGLTGVKQIVAGYDHSLALMEDGTVKAWGNNAKGQLGLGDTTNRSSPAAIPGLSGVIEVDAGLYDSFALLEDGTVKAWGANDYGKLGTGDTSYTYKNTPVDITNLSGVKQIDAGYDHVLALMEDGTVKAWGNNGQSRLGLGDTSNRSTPTLIPGLSGVKQISAGRLHSLAYLENGNVLSWGANPYGQLGVGDTTGRTTPAIVNGLPETYQVITGPSSQHSIAIMRDGTIKTWGYNYYGQLGLSDTTNRNFPTAISSLNYNFSPEIEIISPTAGYILKETDTNFVPLIKVLDTNNDNLDCSYFIDDESDPREVISVTNTSPLQNINFSPVDLSLLPDGDHTIRFDVGDNRGDPIVSTTSFKVDKAGPVINVDSVLSTTSEITINASAVDAVSGLNLYPYKFTVGTEESDWLNSTQYTTQNQLIPNTQYEVSVKARDAIEHITNYTRTIYTKAENPSLNINNVRANSINLSVNDNNPLFTQYQIIINGGEKYVSESGTLTELPEWITLSDKNKIIEGLTNNTEYSIQIKARNGEDIETPLSTAVTCITLEEDPETIIPSAPLNLTYVEKTSSSVNLKWNVPLDARGLAGYKIFMDEAEIGTSNNTEYLISGLNSNTMYSFKIYAFNSVGILSESSNVISVTTDLPPDFEGPSIPMNVTSSAITFTTVDLSWDFSTDNVGVTGYKIYRDSIEIGITNSTVYTDTYLTNGTTYTYTVRAIDASGNISDPSTEIRVTTLSADDLEPPTPPTNLSSPSKTKTSIDLIWNASTDNGGVTGYRIYRNNTLIGVTSGTNYSDTGLSQGTTYAYIIKAFDLVGNNSDFSNEIIVTTDIETDTEAPTAPTNLRLSSKTLTSISLIWDASTDNVAVTSYKVYRDGFEIRLVGGTSITDNELTPDMAYVYTVKACDSAGNISTSSSAITVNTSEALDTEAPSAPWNLRIISKTINSVTLTWNSSVDNAGVMEYIIYDDITPIGSTTGEAIYIVTDLVGNIPYKFAVKARDAAGNVSSGSNVVNITLLINETDRATGGAVLASGEDIESGYGKENVFDDSNTTKWVVNNNTGWIQYQFGSEEKYAVTKYTLTSADDNPDFDPSNWVLKGSNDGENWITLDSRINQNFENRLQKKIYTFNNSSAYEYYKLEFTNLNGNKLQVSEIELIEQALDENTTLLKKDYVIQNPSGKIYYAIQLPDDIENVQELKFIITYNAEQLEVIDLCATTSQINTSVGNIAETGITVERFEPGIIVLSANGFVLSNKRIIDIILFKPKSSSDTALMFTIEE